jgi:hypothetical protein
MSASQQDKLHTSSNIIGIRFQQLGLLVCITDNTGGGCAAVPGAYSLSLPVLRVGYGTRFWANAVLQLEPQVLTYCLGGAFLVCHREEDAG